MRVGRLVLEISIYWEGRGLAFPVSNFWRVIHMSEHSGITVDVPNALNDQTGQGHSQHSELKTAPLPPLSPLFIGDQRIQPTLEKISQSGGGG